MCVFSNLNNFKHYKVKRHSKLKKIQLQFYLQTTLQTDHYAIIRLTVKSFSSEGQIWGDITVETQYEQLSIPVHFKIAQGKLEIGPDRLVFDQCFPVQIFPHLIKNITNLSLLNHQNYRLFCLVS